MRIIDWSSDVCSSDLSGIPWKSLISTQHAFRGRLWKQFKISSFRKPGLNRPRETPLDRLRRKVWIRALRIDAMNLAGMDPEGDLDVTTWKGLARGLLAGYGDAVAKGRLQGILGVRSEEHTSELQSLMRISYAV